MRTFLVATLALLASVVTPTLSAPLSVRGDVGLRDNVPPVSRNPDVCTDAGVDIQLCNWIKAHNDGHY